MATMAAEDPTDRADTSITSSINSSQSNSTFRATEDLLGHRSRPNLGRNQPEIATNRPKPIASTSATPIQRTTESNSSIRRFVGRDGDISQSSNVRHEFIHLAFGQIILTY